MLLKDILSQLVDAGRERKQDYIRLQACSLLASGTSKGSDVLVSLQGFLTELLSCLLTVPASMALPQLVWERSTDLNPHRTMPLALGAAILHLSFELCKCHPQGPFSKPPGSSEAGC